MQEVKVFAEKVIENVSQVIVGKRPTVELALVALFCEGHVLLEDVPGVGKTMLARAMASSLGVSFKRLQCTPDLLPNDITGVSVYNQKTAAFEFRPGPVFVNILLTDEINRATPRTQSALLEAMGERQVTADGITYPLQRPFMVLATQNPIEYEGTFPLPEAQLDRFFLKLSVGYPDRSQEATMLRNLQREHPIEQIGQVVDGQAVPSLAKQIWEVHVDDSLVEYVVSIINATREHTDLSLGASPRGSLALFKGAQALAAIRGRDYVKPDDIKEIAAPALSHRLILKPESALRGRTTRQVLQEVLATTEVKIGQV